MDKTAFINKYSGGFYGDQSSLEKKLADISQLIYENRNENPVLATDDTTLTEDDSGKTYNIATDAKTFTLPKITATNLGMKFRFRNIGDDGDVLLTISPNEDDAIHGSIANSAGDSVAGGVVDKDLENTKATAKKGDWVELVAVALTEWYITGGVGIWASES
jgi:hypothetical protein